MIYYIGQPFQNQIIQLIFFHKFFIQSKPFKIFSINDQRSFELRVNRKSYLLSLIVSMTSSYHRLSSGVTCVLSGAWEFHGMCRKPDASSPPMYRRTHVTHALSIRHLFESLRGCIHPLAKDTRDFFVFALLHVPFPPLRPISFLIALLFLSHSYAIDALNLELIKNIPGLFVV